MQNAFLLKKNPNHPSANIKKPQTIYLSHYFPEEMPGYTYLHKAVLYTPLKKEPRVPLHIVSDLQNQNGTVNHGSHWTPLFLLILYEHNSKSLKVRV